MRQQIESKMEGGNEGAGKKWEDLGRRGRANSTSTIGLMRGKKTEGEIIKRKRRERGGESEELFKRSNKIK